jgi:hypothetical protein
LQGTQGLQGLQGSSDGGVTILDDSVTNTNLYVGFVTNTSGIAKTVYVSSDKLQFNPSTGSLGIGTIFDIIPYDTLNNGTLSFEASAGQIFSITNNLTSGSIFSVNDVSGIPSIDVDADGTIQLAPYGSNEYVGIGTTSPTSKLTVTGDVLVSGVVTATAYFGDGSNLTGIRASQGNTYYVTVEGSDSNPGDSLNEPFLTIQKALSVATSNDKVYIGVGTFTETFPLVIPQGVEVKGSSIRGTFIQPTEATKTNDGFVLNGETSVEDLTIGNFYEPGYGFKFASGMKTVSRSPYMQRVTVLNKGSITSSTDPYGFDTAHNPPVSYKAGRGVLIDGSVVDPTTLEPAMLFNECTFITPNNIALEMTNGARTEWVNCFTYFADKGIYSYAGNVGLGSTGKARIKVASITGTNPSANNQVYYFDSTDNSGTYTRSGTTVDITKVGHGLTTGDRVYADFTSGGGTDGFYIVNNIVGINTFRITDTVSGTTSGNVTYREALGFGTVSSYDSSTGTVTLVGKGEGAFETATSRSGKPVIAYGGARVSTAQQKFGTGSASFDGTGDYLSTPQNADFDFGTGAFTIETFVRINAQGETHYLISKGVDLVLQVDSNNKLVGQCGLTTVTGTTTVAIDTWYHAAFRRDGSNNLQLTLDGSIEGTGTSSDDINNTNAVEFGGRATAPDDSLNGYLDEIRISNISRYSSSFTPTTSQFSSDANTKILLHCDGDNNSVIFNDSTIQVQDVRFVSSGTQIATADEITLADYQQFGAEMRSIGSAAVFGNTGVTADGLGCTLRLFAFNFGHIGSGKDFSQDDSLVNQEDEVIQINGGKVLYVSIDQRGDFRVGNSFYVNEEDGLVSFGGQEFNISSLSNLDVTDGTNTTTITPTSITVGNLLLTGNELTSTIGDIDINPSGINSTNVIGDLNVSGDTNVDGDLSLDGALYDQNGNVGTTTSVLISTGIGVSWALIRDVALQGIQGAQGLQGSQGRQGLQGSQGLQGIQGSQGVGIQGLQGNQGVGIQGLQGSQGRQGLQGSQGLQGNQGSQGLQGNQGSQGNQGLQGSQGRQGLQGSQGNQGLQGLQGTQGNQGLQGLQGLQGTQGNQGLQGSQGRQGAQGLQGSQGNQGLQGLQGTQGNQGLQGSQGRQGLQGSQGNQGVGSQGLQGSQGAQGTQGLQGTQGNQGLQGSQGNQGVGSQGLQGSQGRQGLQGSQGLQGTQGNQGLQGSQGRQGAQGLQGLQGTQGTQGNQGLQGSQGRQGAQGLQGLQGTQGNQGLQGSQGRQGDQGIQGSQGLQGSQGRQGAQGLQGLQGASDGGVTIIEDNSTNQNWFVGILSANSGIAKTIHISQNKLQFNPSTGAFGIGTAIDIVPYDISNGTLSFEGSAGQLFSVTNNLTSGSIFSVNDVSGIPSFDVDANGTVSVVSYGGSLGIGTTNPTAKAHVSGDLRLTGGLYDSNNSIGAASSILVSTGSGVVWQTATGAGAQGSQGTQGLQGTQGNQGLQGSQGRQGAQGIQGSQGRQGAQGIQGSQGRQGSQGIQGLQGSQATQGVQGPAGPSNVLNASAVTTNATFYPVFVAGTGNQTPSIRTSPIAFSFNPSTSDLIIGGNVGVGTANPQYKLHVIGSFAATTKSFVIQHPTRKDKQLRYGSLEGPENGVYLRGRSQNIVIELPDYWTKLVDEDTITVSLTPIGNSVLPRVYRVINNTVEVFSKESGEFDYYFTVFAERKDVEKLEVEF